MFSAAFGSLIACGHAHLDAADGVHGSDEAAEPDLGVVVDPQPCGRLDGADQQRRAAEGVGGVELVAAVTGDGDVGVARDAHQDRTAAAAVQQHDRVRALADVAAGGQFFLLLGRQAGAAVRADDQPVRAGPRSRAVGGQCVDAVERGVDPDAEPDDREQQDE